MEFDYVVIGAGSAGCAVASRLSEDPDVSVALLETGGPDDSALIRAPMGFAVSAALGRHVVTYGTVPQLQLNGRRGYQPRGHVLGGSSAINAMVYRRGHRTDFDGWAALADLGWDYASVLPYFKKAENSECFGANEYHGIGGPLTVSFLRNPFPSTQAFLQACEQQGLTRTPNAPHGRMGRPCTPPPGAPTSRMQISPTPPGPFNARLFPCLSVHCSGSLQTLAEYG
ncbi:GMC family oxidoreductase [Roseateles sp.]|uniref:GMC family oxidoreductase n=1 Tax=Roseateles sp. TaxID=1971397 RepID=UPI0039EA1114